MSSLKSRLKIFPGIGLNPGVIDKILEFGLEQEFKSQTVIIKEYAYVKYVPLVLEGMIKVYKEDENGNEVLLYYIMPGESCIVSILSARNNTQAQIKAIVEEDSRVIFIPIQYIKDIELLSPHWNSFVYQLFTAKYEEVVEMVRILTFSNKEELLTDYLNKNRELTGSDIILKTHNEIARELGSSREVISRLLKKMEKNGKISLNQKKIKLL